MGKGKKKAGKKAAANDAADTGTEAPDASAAREGVAIDEQVNGTEACVMPPDEIVGAGWDTAENSGPSGSIDVNVEAEQPATAGGSDRAEAIAADHEQEQPAQVHAVPDTISEEAQNRPVDVPAHSPHAATPEAPVEEECIDAESEASGAAVSCTESSMNVVEQPAATPQERGFDPVADDGSFHTDDNVSVDGGAAGDAAAGVEAASPIEPAGEEQNDDDVEYHAADEMDGGEEPWSVSEVLVSGPEQREPWPRPSAGVPEMDEDRLMAALGELPPDLERSMVQECHADRTMTDEEDEADADPSILMGSPDAAGPAGDGAPAEAGADEVGSTGTAPDLASASFLEMAQVDGKEAPVKENARDAMEAVLTPSQRASVAELFEKRAPEKVVDPAHRLPVAFLVTAHPDFPGYEPYEEASWWPNRAKIKEESKRPGVKAAIVRTELRGPKSAMYTMYVLHVKTAFHVRGVSRRYSDFVVLDKKLRARFPAAPELRGRSSIIGTLSPSFVQERRQLLQEYLDALLTDHQLAHCSVVRAFLALKPREDAAPGEPQGAEGAAEPVAETGAAGTWRLWDSSGEPMAELLAGLARCKTAQDAPREARLLNKAGLTLCENGAPHEGLAYLQRAVASCRLFRDRRALLRTLGNLACAHLRLGGRGAALELLEESVELAQRLGDAPAEAGCLRKMALAHAADGDLDAGLRAIAEAVELFAGAGDRRGEAAARFTAAVMQYEAGAVVAGVVELERCLLVRRELKDKLGIAEVLSRLGLALVDVGFDLQALDYFERALALCQEEGDLAGEALTLRLLAFVHLAQVDGNRKLSLELFSKALGISRRNADAMGVAVCHEGIGDVHADTDDPRSALTRYKQAAELRQGAADAAAQQRHVHLLQSKMSRARAQLLESAGDEHGATDEEGGGGDFLWRNDVGLEGGSDGDAPAGEMGGLQSSDAPRAQDTVGMGYYRDLAQNAVSRAVARMWF